MLGRTKPQCYVWSDPQRTGSLTLQQKNRNTAGVHPLSCLHPNRSHEQILRKMRVPGDITHWLRLHQRPLDRTSQGLQVLHRTLQLSPCPHMQALLLCLSSRTAEERVRQATRFVHLPSSSVSLFTAGAHLQPTHVNSRFVFCAAGVSHAWLDTQGLCAQA